MSNSDFAGNASETVPSSTAEPSKRPFVKGASWVAISSLIVSALICVYWVLTGESGNIIAQAFLTVLLLTGFSLVVLSEVRTIDFKPQWYVVLSLGAWIMLLILGLCKIWWEYDDAEYFLGASISIAARFVLFALVVGIIRLALLFVRLTIKAAYSTKNQFTRGTALVTVASIGTTAVLLSLPFIVEDWFDGDYWRVTVAIAIIATTGTLVVSLVNALNRPRQTQQIPEVISPYYDQNQQGYYPQAVAPQYYPQQPIDPQYQTSQYQAPQYYQSPVDPQYYSQQPVEPQYYQTPAPEYPAMPPSPVASYTQPVDPQYQAPQPYEQPQPPAENSN